MGYASTTALQFADYERHREGAINEICSLLASGCTSDAHLLSTNDKVELHQLLVELSQPTLCAPGAGDALEQWRCQPAGADKAEGFVPTVSPLRVSTKINYLMHRLRDLVPSHKCIVFTRDNDALMRVSAALVHWGMGRISLDFHSRLPLDTRAAVIIGFNHDPGIRIVLMNTYLAAEGISLTAARYIFILEPVLDPHVEAQAIARAHRIGQHGTVVVEKLLMRDTLEDAQVLPPPPPPTCVLCAPLWAPSLRIVWRWCADWVQFLCVSVSLLLLILIVQLLLLLKRLFVWLRPMSPLCPSGVTVPLMQPCIPS